MKAGVIVPLSHFAHFITLHFNCSHFKCILFSLCVRATQCIDFEVKLG